ncbi:MAG TPA: efflux RND transporter periplasmic adaptor subunit [Phycisphaerae bacterium]|nr:efflux RND transporter periplasmic adaptor subunit [Phycisphaerae bacterium]
MKKWLLRVLVLVVLASAAGVAWRTFRNEESVEVRTATLIQGPLTLAVTTTGRLSPTIEVLVGCEVSGTVEAIMVDHNDMVSKGQVIARLKPELYRAENEQAKANLARAKAELDRLMVQEREAKREYERVHKLFQGNSASEHEDKNMLAAYDAAKANTAAGQAAIESADSQVSLTQYHLDRTVITSPIDGVVLDRRVDVGQTIAATLQTPVLFVLAGDLSRMDLQADVSESDIGFLCPGQTARFTVNAYRDRSFVGIVHQVRNQPRTVSNVVTYTVVIKVDNPEHMLRPGMPADVTIEVVHSKDIPKLSNAALRFRPPLPADQLRELLEGVVWPAPPPPVMVAATQPQAVTVVPPPIEPTKATLWRYLDQHWEPIGVWTLFTDNRETAVYTGLDAAAAPAFAVEVHRRTSSRSLLKDAILLSRPENRQSVLTRPNQ